MIIQSMAGKKETIADPAPKALFTVALFQFLLEMTLFVIVAEKSTDSDERESGVKNTKLCKVMKL